MEGTYCWYLESTNYCSNAEGLSMSIKKNFHGFCMHKPTNSWFLTLSLLAFLGIQKGWRVQHLKFSHGILQYGLSLQPKSREGRRKRQKRRGSS
jgi:hypothetical protein